jgi:CheY-like chemotaxis protein
LLIEEASGNAELVEYAQEIQEAGSRAGALTAQLLAFSRRQISQPRVLDLNEVVSHSMKMLRRLIGEDIEFTTHLDPGAARIKADPTQIDQIVMNLVVNARDAMGDGGKLTIETQAATLDAEYVGRHIGVAPGEYTMLAISDTGTGMDAATKSRIFEPFFTTKEAGRGTGLGLSIVYGIVKQNAGEVMVYSEPGKGTTFKVYFPAIEENEERPVERWELADLRGHETILLCEDEERIRHLVRRILVRQGYQVLETDLPLDAIRVAQEREGKIDLLFTDVVMPQLNGFELAKKVRQMAPDIKVLYMSGYTDKQVSGGWVLDPDTPFMQKPFTAEGLLRKVREVLGNNAAQP